MTERRVFFLSHETARRRAAEYCAQAPDGQMVVFSDPKRTSEQNARMWAMLGDVSRQVDWYGQKLQPEEWKDVFTAALKKQRAVPGLDGGFVILGARTSKMGKREMGDLMELMSAFGAERNVQWGNEA